MNQLLDRQYTFRILKALTGDFKDMPAYHLGIIDADGNVLRKSYQLKSEAERNAYTHLDRLIITLKKAIDKLKTRGDYNLNKALSPALWLVREQKKSNSKSLSGISEKYTELYNLDVTLAEEEIQIQKFFKEEGEGGAPTNNTAGVAGLSKETGGPVVKNKDIKRFRTMARRIMPQVKEIK